MESCSAILIMMRRWSVDGLFFISVPHREKHSERKREPASFLFRAPPPWLDSHLQGSLLQSRRQRSTSHPFNIIPTACLLCGLHLQDSTQGPGEKSAPGFQATLHLPRNSACFTGFLTKAPCKEPLPYNLSPSFSTTKRHNRRKIQIT